MCFAEVVLLAEKWQTLTAGLLGFGGLAWVTYKGQSHERRRQRQSDNALLIALSVELVQLAEELATARRLLEEGGDHIPMGQASLKNVHKSAFFDQNLEKTGNLPVEFLTTALDFLFAKRDVSTRYGSAQDIDVDRAIAAIASVEALLPPVLKAAKLALPSFDFDALRD